MIIDVPWWKAQCLVDAIMEKYKEYAEHNKVWCSEDNMLGTITKNGIITIHNMGTELTHVNSIFDVDKIECITVLSGTGIYYRITNENCHNVSDGTIDTVLFWINNIDETNDVRIEIEYYTDDWAVAEGFYESINSNPIFNRKGNVYDVIAKIHKKGINFELGYYTDR